MLRAVILILILGVVSTWGQPFSFSREVKPFPLRDSFFRPYERPFLGGYNTARPQFVDIDNDGDSDLFLQESDDLLTFFKNNGSAGQPQWVWQSDDWFVEDIGAWFAFSDFDKDGDSDLYCQGQGLAMRLYSNNQGSFDLLADTLRDIAGDPIYPELQTTPVFFDIDCDGDEDLFLGRQSGSITFYERVGEESGLPRFEFITDSWQDILVIGGGLSKDGLHGANNLAFAQLEGSSAVELLFGDFFSRSLYYFVNEGSCANNDLQLAAEHYPPGAPLATGGFNTPRLYDVDNDGDSDLFVTVLGGFYSPTLNLGENFYFYKNEGTANQSSFELQTRNYFDQWDGSEQSIPALVDIDDDGDQDLFVGTRNYQAQNAVSGRLYFFENTGSSENPDFYLRDTTFVVEEGAYHYAPAFGDLDGDGDFDLLLGRDNGKILHYENTGSKTFAEFTLRTKTFADIDVGANSVPLIIDVDRDGNIDLLVGEFSGTLNYFTGDGNGGFVLQDEDFGGLSALGETYLTVAFGGRENDVLQLWLGGESGRIYHFSQEGQTLQVQASGLRLQTRSAPFAVDIDNDGDRDLLCGNRGGGLAFFRNLEVSTLAGNSLPVPRSFSVGPAYPNPFNGRVNFTVNIPGTSLAVTVHDISGREVRRLSPAGSGLIQWDAMDHSGRPLPSGLYIFRFQNNNRVLLRKVLYLK